jgi:PP-loop family/Queuosine biosynthesis protein QueC
MQYICGPNKSVIDFEFPEGTNKKIIVAVSGGADSAILLYILAKMNRDLNLNHRLIPFTTPRPDGGIKYSPAIVQWINNKLQVDIPAPMIAGDGNLPHNVVMFVITKDLMDSGDYDYLFTGGNKVPPIKINALPPVRASKSNPNGCSIPFWGVTKEATIDLYYQENVPELLELSHSCTEKVIGRCGKCFNCVEREWGFAQLGKTDPGVK